MRIHCWKADKHNFKEKENKMKKPKENFKKK